MKKGLMERMAVLLIAALFAAAYGAIVYADDMEWDPAWGYQEEEWYDPSDWFGDDARTDYKDQYYGGHDSGDRLEYDEYGYDDQSTYDEYGYDDPGFAGFGGSDFGWDYYTHDWYDDEPDFDNWWTD